MIRKLSFVLFYLASFSVAIAQQDIGGVVKSASGEPLAGATVMEKGTSNGTITDLDGKFNLSVQSNRAILVVSYLGYETLEVPASRNLTIILTTDIQQLDEIVILGYGTVKKSDLTGSVVPLRTEDFEDQPMIRVEDALNGRTAGVFVNRSNGSPGAPIRIRIRGSNSINGSSEPLYVIDGFIGADIRNVDPDDIATLEVLKDASATSIYGSRGANGVIIITTRRAEKGEAKIDFDYFYSADEVSKKIDLLNAADYMQVVNEKQLALGNTPFFTQDEIDSFRRNGGTDWQDELFQQGYTQNAKLTISGAGEKTNYYISGNYSNQKGIIRNSSYKRYGFRTNIDSDVRDFIKVGTNLYFTRENNLNTKRYAGTGGPVVGALGWAPNLPVKDPLSGDYSAPNGAYGAVTANPIFTVEERNTEDFRNYFLGNVYTEIKIFEGLTARISGGVNLIDDETNTFDRNFPGASPSTSIIRVGNSSIVNWQNTNQLTYQKVIKDDHSLNATFIYEQQAFTSKSNNSSTSDLISTSLGYYNLSLGGSPVLTSGYSEWALQSYVGRVNYAFRGKYLLTASVRTDGSSRFAEENRYGTFPSVAIGWRVTEESFLHNSNWLSDLKIRGSYGQTGSQAVPPFGTIERIRVAAFPLNGTQLSPTVIPSAPSNKDLRWEVTTQVDLGVDASFLRGKLNASFDFYKKNTEDLHLSVQLPLYDGGGSVLRNIGEVENKGFEMVLGYTEAIGDFRVHANFNLSMNRNKVLSLGEDSVLFVRDDFSPSVTDVNPFVLSEGGPLGQFAGYVYEGVWKSSEADLAGVYGSSPGDARYADINGDSVINFEDVAVIGNAQPNFIWGFNSIFEYKGISLNLFFQGVHGNEVFNFNKYWTTAGGADIRNATNRDILNRWTPENENSEIPGFTTTSNTRLSSSQFIEDGSFVRLRNITLGYDIPTSVLSRIGLRRANIYLSGQNLLTMTNYSGYDPEVSSTEVSDDVAVGLDNGAYPNARSYIIGVKIGL